jgi:hypothetical protein
MCCASHRPLLKTTGGSGASGPTQCTEMPVHDSLQSVTISKLRNNPKPSAQAPQNTSGRAVWD